MPAERTRGSRRSGADGTQLVWTMPVEPTTPTGIAFATNVTPVTFNDPPPQLVDAPFESILFPPDETPSPRRPGHSKKKPENHIPRPPNAFILFRSSFIKSQHVSTEVETNHSTLSKIIGLTWQNLPNDERQVWHAKAKAALDEHKRKFPQYAFRPLHSKAKGGTEKRKVREVGPKDLKRCAKIAELLVEGLKGQELDAAIQEFDKHHVPEVVTRFEAPLTARMYRRSSSAPIPDVGPSQTFLPSSPHTSSRKLRASSSQPTRHSTPAPTPPPIQEQYSSGDMAINPFFGSHSFDPYSFPSKQEPSFDFNTFSFDNITSPMPMFECDPLSPASSCDSPPDLSGIFSHQPDPLTVPAPRRGLSIDTSFMTEWTRSSSPMSSSSNNSMPATPHYFDSPSPDPFSCGSFNLDAFEQHPLSKSFDEHSLTKSLEEFDPSTVSSHFPAIYSHQNTFNQNELYLPQSEFVPFEQNPPKPELAHLDVDFSAFMASLPQYSL